MKIETFANIRLCENTMVLRDDEINNGLMKDPFVQKSELDTINSKIENLNPEVSVIYSSNKDVSLSVNG
jgi:hypothetical protein